MKIRVFLCQWTEVVTEGQVSIENPIDTALSDVRLSDPLIIGRNFYARVSQAKRPDKLYMIKVMRGDLADAEWTFIDNIGGVQMVPPTSFDAPVSSFNTPTRNRIYSALDSLGIPRTIFASASSVGGFLRNLTAELDPARVGFDDWELLTTEWA